MAIEHVKAWHWPDDLSLDLFKEAAHVVFE